MEKRLLNVEEVATYTGMTQHTIRAWVKQGYIPYSRLGRSVRFDMLKIEQWLKQKECSHSG